MELYNLTEDLGEKKNLASAMPTKRNMAMVRTRRTTTEIGEKGVGFCMQPSSE